MFIWLTEDDHVFKHRNQRLFLIYYKGANKNNGPEVGRHQMGHKM